MRNTNKWLLCILGAAFFAGCMSDSSLPDNSNSGYDDMAFSQHELALQKADSCDDYRAHLLDAAARRLADNRFSVYSYWGDDFLVDGMPENALPEMPGSDSAGSNDSAGEFTTTNIQEEGVDEVDSLKNDGTWMYTVNNDYQSANYGGIEIVKAWPANEMKKVAVIPSLKNDDNGYAYPIGLLLKDNRLIILDGGFKYNNEKNYYGNSIVIARIYDVSDPTQPKLMKKHEMEGNYVTARLIDKRVHLMMSASATSSLVDIYNLYQAEIPGVPLPNHENRPKYKDYQNWEEYDKAMSEYRDMLYEMKETYLPVIRAWLDTQYPDSSWLNWPQISDGSNSQNMLGCADLYIPKTTSTEDGMLILADISGDDFDTVKASAIADYGWTVYASAKNIYVVSTSSNWYWSCYSDDDNCKNYSHIHRFNIDAQGTRYVNSGEIEGIVSDPFWMSEYDGHLRVAAEDAWWNGENQGSSLNILKLDGPQMQVVGRLTDLGLNEQLYAARMFGPKGYMVTFRRTDPLYTLDLSNPSDPKVMGELKITGYSSYIHPMGENHLLTIGEDADLDGRVTGLQLQIFDVSDMTNPKQAYKELIEISPESYSYSEALYDHHAFTYHAGSGLLAVPVNIYDWSWDDYQNRNFTGMLVYEALPDKGFKRIGAIDHGDFIESANQYRWWTDLNRSRIMFKTAGEYTKDAYIYTVSALGIKANNVLNPKEEFAAVKF